jgi:uncharacterized membrane protein
MMLLIAMILATLTIRLDEMHMLDRFGKISWLIGGSPDDARSFLSTIATAMITIASVTFSMTLLAVTFAGSQIGPRLTTNFMRDRANQLTLGFFIAAFLYCLLVMRSIVQNNDQAHMASHHGLLYVPQISLLVALGMAVIGLIVLVSYMHHVPNSINMSHVIASVGTSLFNQVETRFPCGVGEGADHTEINISPDEHQHLTIVLSPRFGYIRVLDAGRLIELAKTHDCILQLKSDIGDFLTIHTPLLFIYSSKPVSQELIEQCQKTYALGNKRNQEQDLDFLVNELIEIIARALSPGVNDPFTAINAFDWLYLFLNKIANSAQPRRARKDTEGQVRLLTSSKDITYYTDMIFTATRLYVCKDYMTTMHVLNLLKQLATITEKEHKMLFEGHAHALIHDAKMTMKNMSVTDYF